MKRSVNVLIAAVLAVLGTAVAVPSADAADTASITGHVRFAGTGAPAAGSFVSIARLEQQYVFGKPVQVPMFFAHTTSDAAGAYALQGLPPSDKTGYWVCFSINDGFPPTYEPQCYANEGGLGQFPNPLGWLDFPYNATTIWLKAGQHIGDIDAAMFPNLLGSDAGPRGKLTGKVRDAFGLPLSFVKISVFDGPGRIVDNSVTKANGTYRVQHLLTGAYAICFDGSDARGGITLRAFKSRCYSRAAWAGHEAAPPSGAIRVGVTDGQTTPNINLVLPATL